MIFKINRGADWEIFPNSPKISGNCVFAFLQILRLKNSERSYIVHSSVLEGKTTENPLELLSHLLFISQYSRPHTFVASHFCGIHGFVNFLGRSRSQHLVKIATHTVLWHHTFVNFSNLPRA